MTKNLLFSLALLGTLSLKAQTTTIPDPKFEQALISLGYDDIIDGQVNTSAIGAITSLDVSSRGIQDLTGIEDFIALEELNCSKNKLPSLDFSNNTELKKLDCSFNESYGVYLLTNLDISANIALEELNCSRNALTNLDISNNIALVSLNCSKNNLANLNFSANIGLTELNCGENDLTTIDVSPLTALTILNCSLNNLTSLDINANTALTSLSCSYNNLTSIDVSLHTALTSLNCNETNLTSLDLSNNPLLTELRCSFNALTNLDLSNNNQLELIICSHNELTSLDVSSKPQLYFLWVQNNSLTNLNLKNGNNEAFVINGGIPYINISNNPDLFCVEVDDAAYSTTNWTVKDEQTIYSEEACQVYVPDDNFEQALIDLGYDSVLDDYVLLTNINTITNLDVSSKEIEDLTGIEAFEALEILNCNNNSLTSLDMSANSALTSFSCNTNNLTSLNLQFGINIAAGRSSLNTTIDITNNPDLTCVEVDNVDYSNANWTIKDPQTNYSLSCSGTLSNEAIELKNIEIYPNPSSGVFYVKVNEAATYSVLSVTGQTLKQGSLNQGHQTIDLSILEKSLYFLKIDTSKGSFTKQLIIK
ncbi:T9SS type A sorting domain-containing protein [Mangrovimonas xylaniphaga]|uniref:T9SS type A sorting domain-containing protein n=1 Tax=Mangrovimonas xylaniphaga TaxID=1645915 RepID=UPI0006B445F6|nr:T9SS type A sorting domain-containing protein [Mangrovimonas xylaniphaga]